MMIDNNNSKISVMLVDDHPMVQGGLTACLAFYDDIEIVGATDDGAEALSKAKELKDRNYLRATARYARTYF